MKVNYRNCQLEAYRGARKDDQQDLVFYSAFTKDGLEITSGCSDGFDSVRDWIDTLKQIVDEFYEFIDKYNEIPLS